MKVNELVVMQQLISDHKALCFQLNFQKPLNERKSVVSRRLRNFDFESFNEMIISSGLLADASDLPLEMLVDRYDNVLRDTMDILAPVKSRTIVPRPNPPWYNEDIGLMRRGEGAGYSAGGATLAVLNRTDCATQSRDYQANRTSMGT